MLEEKAIEQEVTARRSNRTAAGVAEGIKDDRMSAVGRGQDTPVADNRSDEGRAKNRRVEVVKE